MEENPTLTKDSTSVLKALIYKRSWHEFQSNFYMCSTDSNLDKGYTFPIKCRFPQRKWVTCQGKCIPSTYCLLF